MTAHSRLPRALFPVPLDDGLFDLDTLCRATAVSPAWVVERVEAGLLQVAQGHTSAHWRFDAVTLRRVRQMRRCEHDFDAVPELAALVSDLLEEIARLKAELRSPARRRE